MRRGKKPPTLHTAHSRRRVRVAEPLNVSHWPQPSVCGHCLKSSSYQLASGLTLCVSSICDPNGATWRALDRYFRDHPTERKNYALEQAP